MAKYKVVQFAHVIKDNGNGYDNLYLSLTLQNSAGNSANREYRIARDDVWTDLQALTHTITDGLTFAKQTGSWIELSDFEARTYLSLVLPSAAGKKNMRVTAEKL
ncbi:hypothetical protein ALP03_200102 [Pseudomonas amygdali pv. tabaci]|uniref:Single-stranded DNA-binding protein n=1 Tax=Pseudomonas amygdali pv. tabaci TaxID=322 RepID=A0A3M6HSD8_PSEAJ|nr:hypothetical protein ALP03_200102 [Pseudomonas amygdali pv. tabaci]